MKYWILTTYLGTTNWCNLKKEDLCFQLQGQSDLVTALLEVFAINESRQGKGHPISQLLLVPKTNMRRVVNLSTDRSWVVQAVLATNAEWRFILWSYPSYINSSFKRKVLMIIKTLTKYERLKMKREALSILLPSLIFPGRLLLRLRSLVTFREMITRQILFAQGIFKLLSRANSQFLERL